MIGEKLLDALTKIEKLYNNLIELASLKKEAILISDYDGLVRITGQEQKSASQIESVEKERAKAVEAFLKEKGLAPDTGLSVIIKGGHIRSELVNDINNLKERIISLSSEIKKRNEENNALINSSRDIIEASIGVIKNKISAGSKSSLNKRGAYSNISKTGANKNAQAKPPGADSCLLDFIV